MSSPSPNTDKVLKRGWLSKRKTRGIGRLQGWKKVYIRLSPQTLVYYRNESNMTPMESINLEGILSVVVSQSDKFKFKVMAIGKKMAFRSQTTTECNEWVRSIKDAIGKVGIPTSIFARREPAVTEYKWASSPASPALPSASGSGLGLGLRSPEAAAAVSPSSSPSPIGLGSSGTASASASASSTSPSASQQPHPEPHRPPPKWSNLQRIAYRAKYGHDLPPTLTNIREFQTNALVLQYVVDNIVVIGHFRWDSDGAVNEESKRRDNVSFSKSMLDALNSPDSKEVKEFKEMEIGSPSAALGARSSASLTTAGPAYDSRVCRSEKCAKPTSLMCCENHFPIAECMLHQTSKIFNKREEYLSVCRLLDMLSTEPFHAALGEVMSAGADGEPSQAVSLAIRVFWVICRGLYAPHVAATNFNTFVGKHSGGRAFNSTAMRVMLDILTKPAMDVLKPPPPTQDRMANHLLRVIHKHAWEALLLSLKGSRMEVRHETLGRIIALLNDSVFNCKLFCEVPQWQDLVLALFLDIPKVKGSHHQSVFDRSINIFISIFLQFFINDNSEDNFSQCLRESLDRIFGFGGPTADSQWMAAAVLKAFLKKITPQRILIADPHVFTHLWQLCEVVRRYVFSTAFWQPIGGGAKKRGSNASVLGDGSAKSPRPSLLLQMPNDGSRFIFNNHVASSSAEHLSGPERQDLHDYGLHWNDEGMVPERKLVRRLCTLLQQLLDKVNESGGQPFANPLLNCIPHKSPDMGSMRGSVSLATDRETSMTALSDRRGDHESEPEPTSRQLLWDEVDFWVDAELIVDLHRDEVDSDKIPPLLEAFLGAAFDAIRRKELMSQIALPLSGSGTARSSSATGGEPDRTRRQSDSEVDTREDDGSNSDDDHDHDPSPHDSPHDHHDEDAADAGPVVIHHYSQPRTHSDTQVRNDRRRHSVASEGSVSSVQSHDDSRGGSRGSPSRSRSPDIPRSRSPGLPLPMSSSRSSPNHTISGSDSPFEITPGQTPGTHTPVQKGARHSSDEKGVHSLFPKASVIAYVSHLGRGQRAKDVLARRAVARGSEVFYHRHLESRPRSFSLPNVNVTSAGEKKAPTLKRSKPRKGYRRAVVRDLVWNRQRTINMPSASLRLSEISTMRRIPWKELMSKCKIVNVISSGSSAITKAMFEARVVAIKTPRNPYSEQGRRALEMEARVLHALNSHNHPSVVHLVGAATVTARTLPQEDTRFLSSKDRQELQEGHELCKGLVLDWAEGWSLDAFLSRPDSDVSLSRRLQVAIAVAEALAMLQDSVPDFAVHWEYKPQNVMVVEATLTEDLSAPRGPDRIVLMDFGAARIQERFGSSSVEGGEQKQISSDVRIDVRPFGGALPQFFTGKVWELPEDPRQQPSTFPYLGDERIQATVEQLARSAVGVLEERPDIQSIVKKLKHCQEFLSL